MLLHGGGGMVALVYAARHPGQVCVQPRARTDRKDQAGRLGGDEVAAVVERVYGGDNDSVTPEEWAPCWELFGPSVPGGEERARTVVNVELNTPGLELMQSFDVLDQLARVESPALVCVGELDPITPVAAAREIADALPEGSARLEVLAGAGHFPWRDVPDRYWPLLTDFVS